MTRVIHTGDTHIGYQQYHSPQRRADFLAAFEQVIDDAIEMDVDAVVHAGDLFHDRRPDLPDLMGTLSALRELAAAEIPFLAIVGNHESTRGGQWIDLFERLDLATRLDSDPTVVDRVAFYGLDHVPESRRDELEYAYTPPTDAPEADPTHAVLVGHGLFTPFAHANWETETVLTESTVDFDAVLLGDNHAPGTDRVNETWVTYCGSTERASASETDPRGYNVVQFDAETAGADGVDIRRRSLSDATRDFEFVSVDLNAGEGTARVQEKLSQYDLDDSVVIIEITGDGETVTPGEIESFALDRGALIARVTDRREIDTESELSVSFADPDAAVDDRVAELGLSEAAVEIDSAIRSPDVAVTNLRSTVKSRLKEQLEADPAALERPESPADSTTADNSETADDDSTKTADDASNETAADANSKPDDATTETADTESPGTAGEDGESNTANEDGESNTANEDGESDNTNDELTTMEDFL